MYIERLEVKGFGKLAGLELSFKRGINIIYGGNETGKTTLQWFIRGMLYGLRKTRQTKQARSGQALPPLKRFEPWHGGHYGGMLVYTLDDGSKYRVERNFNSGTVQLFDSHYNNITGSFDIGRDKVPAFAERQLGLDETTFERTALIKQLEIRLDEDSLAVLSGRLANAGSTGFEEISLGKAEKALTEARRSNIGTGRTTTQPLDKLEATLKKLTMEHDRLIELQEQRRLIWEKWQEIQDSLSVLEAEEKFLKHVEALVEIRKTLDAGLKREAGLKEAVRQLKELEGAAVFEEAHAAAGTKARPEAAGKAGRPGILPYVTPLLCAAIAALLIALSIYTAAAKGFSSSWKALSVYISGAVAAGLTCILLFRKKRKIRIGAKLSGAEGTAGNTEAVSNVRGEAIAREAERRTAEKSICSGASLLCERQLNEPADVKQALKDISAELEELSRKLEQGIEAAAAMECRSAGCFNADNLEALLYDSSAGQLEEALKNELERVKAGLLEGSLEKKYYEGILESSRHDSEELQHVVEETASVKERIDLLKFKGKALKLAHDVLLEAGLEIKRACAPDLDGRMSAIIAGLTAGRYADLRGDDGLALKVAVPESGDIKNVLDLSGAAVDQMYLALRLAMADMLTEGKESLPLIMDEVFSQFDDKRTLLALEYLNKAYENRQVLIFTCKRREVELAGEICGDSINLVEL